MSVDTEPEMAGGSHGPWFHTHHGWWWRIREDAAVEVVHTTTAIEPNDTNQDSRHEMDRATWESVVRHVEAADA